MNFKAQFSELETTVDFGDFNYPIIEGDPTIKISIIHSSIYPHKKKLCRKFI